MWNSRAKQKIPVIHHTSVLLYRPVKRLSIIRLTADSCARTIKHRLFLYPDYSSHPYHSFSRPHQPSHYHLDGFGREHSGHKTTGRGDLVATFVHAIHGNNISRNYTESTSGLFTPQSATTSYYEHWNAGISIGYLDKTGTCGPFLTNDSGDFACSSHLCALIPRPRGPMYRSRVTQPSFEDYGILYTKAVCILTICDRVRKLPADNQTRQERETKYRS